MLDQVNNYLPEIAMFGEQYTLVFPQSILIKPRDIRQGIITSIVVIAGIGAPLL